MNPPNYDSQRGFPDIERSAKATEAAIAKAKPGKIVFLSTIGAPCRGVQSWLEILHL
jgi:NAD(P)H dehydrogenase (quinone)